MRLELGDPRREVLKIETHQQLLHCGHQNRVAKNGTYNLDLAQEFKEGYFVNLEFGHQKLGR